MSENCPLSCQIKRIPAITGMARKRTLHATNLNSPLALAATWFKVSVDAGADAGYSTSMILREFKSCGVPDSRHVFQRNGQFGFPADVNC
jgi:hypothetical protein